VVLDKVFFREKAKTLFPWAAGASFALGHIAVTQCTLPKQGQCVLCGGCAFAITGLVGWALYKNRQIECENNNPQLSGNLRI
jgi:hypothetical protein